MTTAPRSFKFSIAEGWYSEGDLDPARGYLYIAIVYNLSILFAMLALVWFYVAAKDFLASVSSLCCLLCAHHPGVVLTFFPVPLVPPFFLFQLFRPHKPVLKFLIVKSVIFLAFWQVRYSLMQVRVENCLQETIAYSNAFSDPNPAGRRTRGG